jgi:hypothetical protein
MLLVAGLLFMTSCSILSQKHVTGHFSGLDSALQLNANNHGVVRLMFVHGMGSPGVGYSEVLSDKLAKELSLKAQNDGIVTNDFVKGGFNYGRVRIKSYHQNGKLKLRVYEVTWSPSVDGIKANRFSYDETFSKYRLFVNRYAKSELMNARLADPVLYTGTYKEHMQYPVMRGIATVLDDQFDQQQDEFAIVAYSLGSRMAFDTLVKMGNGEKILNEAPYQMENANRLLDRTGYIFMLANQLPLLGLGNIESPEGKLPMTGLRGLVDQRSNRTNRPEKPVSGNDPLLHVVSFSDPNDLLSYPLDEANVREGIANTESVIISNVRISIARIGWLFLLANPLQAHTGFDQNDSIVQFLAHGSKKK